MAYYLQMDGTDDSLYYTGTSFTIDEIILDCSVTSSRGAFDKYQGSSNGRFLQRNGSNQDNFNTWTTVELNGVPQTNNTSFIPIDTRVAIRMTGSPISNSQIYIFANNTAGAGAMPGKIYGVTLKNSGVTVLQWDLTLGHVIDQSGNGRNGTLNGGTWVEETPTGTPGSVSYATKQAITAFGSVAYATRQQLTSIGSAAMATKQVLNRVAATAYATAQSIISGAVPGSSVFATRQVLRATAATQHATKQAFSAAGSAAYATRQNITQAGAFVLAATKQIINNPSSIAAATSQRLFATSSAVHATKQKFGMAGVRVYATFQDIVDANNAIARHVSIAGKANRAAIDGEADPAEQERRVNIGGEI